MPNPTITSVHVNRPLTNIAIAYKQTQENFIADRVFPAVPVEKRSDAYFTYDRSYWFRSEVRKRAPGTESAGGGYKVGTDNYFADVYALHKDIDDQIRANTDVPLNADRDAAQWLTTQFLIFKENVFSSTYLQPGVWTFQVDGVASNPTAAGSFDPTNLSANDKLQWNDPASTPIEDIRNAKAFMLERTGYEPNKLTLGYKVYNALLDHPDVIDRIKYGQTPGGPAMVSKRALAALFEVDEILVAKGIQNTAVEGLTEANSFIVGKHALLSYAPSSPGLLIPSAGYIFNWTGYTSGFAGAADIRKFRMEHLRADRIEGETAFALKKVAGDLGYFFNGIVA